jgi:hypothetical protein
MTASICAIAETVYEKVSRCTASTRSARIRFAFELVNEGCCLTQPFESLLGGQPIEFRVTVEILGRALSQSALEFFAR